MALTATIYRIAVQLSDVDRGVYESLDLHVARHPSESAEYLLTRILAYCLEYEEGIAFTEGLSAGDEPAVVIRDLTGRVTAWIEVGAPDAERLHRASKAAGRVAVYTQRDPMQLAGQWSGKKIHRAAEIPVITFGRGFIEKVAPHLERRTSMTLTVTEREMYLDLDGESFTTALERGRVGG